jgi:hypothetical protein
VIFDICSALTLTDLRTIFVYNADLSEAAWLSAFGHLTSLRSVHVSGPSAYGIVSALSGEKDDIEGFFLSGLHDLWLKGTQFVDFNAMRFFRELQICLMTRRQGGAEIQELHLHKCRSLYSEDVDLLKEIVGVVDCDKIELEDEDFSDGDEDEDEDEIEESDYNEVF